jgi:hypothetical protein
MSKAIRLLLPLAAVAVIAACLLRGQTSAAQQGQGGDSAAAGGSGGAAGAATPTPTRAARPADSAAAGGGGSSGSAAGTATPTPTQVARPADPADWAVSAPAALVDPVGSRVEFTVTVDNPGRAARGTIVFALNGVWPESPGLVEATIERRSPGRWVALPEEGAAGTLYFETEAVKFQHGRTVLRFRIGHPADASPNRIRMRTYALVAGTATPAAHTTVKVPAGTAA